MDQAWTVAAMVVLAAGGCSNPAGNATNASAAAPANSADMAAPNSNLVAGGREAAMIQMRQTTQGRPATPAALAAATMACRGMPADSAAAARQLTERGWPRAAPNAPDGRPAPIFGRDNVVIMVISNEQTARAGGSVCNIIGALDPAVSLADLSAAMTRAVGSPPGETDGNQAGWELGDGWMILLTRLPGPPPAANIYVMSMRDSPGQEGTEGQTKE